MQIGGVRGTKFDCYHMGGKEPFEVQCYVKNNG